MHAVLALAFACALAAPGCRSLPVKRDSVRNDIHTIVSIAQITLVHIRIVRAKLPDAPQIDVSTPSIEGLTSISHDLELLDHELQDPSTEILSQVQADVSSLAGWVRTFTLTMNCPVPAGPSAGVSEKLFPDSHFYLTLTRVQLYLEKVLLNKDKLLVC